jgi:hypothetical protein
MRTDLSCLSDDATTWIFGVSPSLDSAGTELVLETVDRFLDQWASHGTPVLAGRELVEGSFLVIAAEKSSETSGCSIDKMFGQMRQLEQSLGVSILDGGRVFYRDPSGAIRGSARSAFREVGSEETPVFDTTVQTLGEVRHGSWQRRAADSWHAALLRRSA